MPPADLMLLLPVILVLAGACVTLAAEPFLGTRAKHAWLPWIAAAALLAAGVALALTGPGHLHGIFALDPARRWLGLAVLAAALVAGAGLQSSLSRDRFPGGEPHALFLFASAGALLMVMATDALSLFVSLEITSLAVYACVGLRRNRAESNEGLLKYFVMGAVFSAVFLYGTALVYGATGATAFGAAPLPGRSALHLIGHGLIIIALLFKVGAVPFHFWSPDAYTGAPVAVTGFMGAVIKVGGFAALGTVWLNLASALSGTPISSAPLRLDTALAPSAEAITALQPLNSVLLVVALLSLIIGTFSALRQTSVRRLIAFSSVANAGYMILAFALPSAGGTLDLAGLWIYLGGYALATAGAMTAITALAGPDDDGDDLKQLTGLGRSRPFHGLVLTVFVASFAGLPPSLGFLGKFLVLAGLVAKSWIWIAGIALVAALVGAAFYLGLLARLWSSDARTAPDTGDDLLARWTLAGAAVAVVVLILWPGWAGATLLAVK